MVPAPGAPGSRVSTCKALLPHLSTHGGHTLLRPRVHSDWRDQLSHSWRCRCLWGGAAQPHGDPGDDSPAVFAVVASSVFTDEQTPLLGNVNDSPPPHPAVLTLRVSTERRRQIRDAAVSATCPPSSTVGRDELLGLLRSGVVAQVLLPPRDSICFLLGTHTAQQLLGRDSTAARDTQPQKSWGPQGARGHRTGSPVQNPGTGVALGECSWPRGGACVSCPKFTCVWPASSVSDPPHF